MARQRKSVARKFLDKLSSEPLTFGSMLKNIRECDELSLADLAAKLKVSRQHLHAIETGRRAVSTERAARWARVLEYPEAQFVRLALQADIDAAGLKYRVQLRAA
jgi:transcriptional regulator with XRE-family HTH domain